MDYYGEIDAAVQKGSVEDVARLVSQAIDEALPAQEILSNGLMSGMAVIGEKFKRNEVYVPEVLMAARAMNAGIEILKPLLGESGAQAKGKAVIGTVKGDLHDIGKNLVKIMMEGKGIEVIDLGVNVEPQKFVDTAVNEGAQIIACSALLTTTMNVMKDVVSAVQACGIQGQVKVMVGGAPVTQDFCDSIGADFYSPDAASASDTALHILNG